MTRITSWNRLAHASPSEVAAIQTRALRTYVQQELYPFSKYYRRVFDEAGVRPSDIRTIRDLEKLPFTTKQDFATAQASPETKRDFVVLPTPKTIKESWPFSRKLALVLGGKGARESLAHSYRPNFLTFTTGRSSEPVAFAYTPHDLDILSEAGARMLTIHGITDPMARIVNMFPFAPHLAFWAATMAGFRTGRLMVPTGGGKVMGTSGNLRLISRTQPDTLIGTPGFVYHVLRHARGEGADLSSIKLVILGAEKVPPGLKAKMTDALQACGASDVVISGTYGFTEARMAFPECPTPHDVSSGYHTYPDLGLFEVVDPETGKQLGEGETGELVYSSLSGHGTTVFRYRTGDIAVGGISYGPCPHCGRSVPRISSELRRASERKSMSLTKVKGTLVDLSHIGTVLSSNSAIEEWQVVLTKRDNDPYGLDELTIRLTPKDGANKEQVERELRTEILEATEISPNCFEFHSLDDLLALLGMETEMKEKRYLDERPT